MTAICDMKDKWLDRFERFMLLLLFINPFLDIFNGIFTYVLTMLTKTPFAALGVSITPSLVLRMVLLVSLLGYLLLTKDRPIFFTLLCIGVVWLMTVAGMFFFSAYEPVSFFSEIQYMARFVFNLSVLLLFGKILLRRFPAKNDAVSFLAKTFAWTLSVLSSSIVLCALFKVGYSTYADRYGYRGTRGFFYAGNDITAVLMVLLPLVVCLALSMPRNRRKKQLIFFIYAAGSTLTALLLIGSKTAFVAAIGTVAVDVIAAVWQAVAKRSFYPVLRFAFILLTCGSLFFVLMLPDLLAKQEPGIVGQVKESWQVSSEIAQIEGTTVALLSGRQVKMLAVLDEVKAAGPYAYLFGLGRGSQPYTLEMDLFEFLFFYGLIGSIAMLWIYVRDGFRAIIAFFKKPNIVALGALMGLAMTVGYGLMAGHVFFSVTAGFYLAITLVFCNIFFMKDQKEAMEHEN